MIEALFQLSLSLSLPFLFFHNEPLWSLEKRDGRARREWNQPILKLYKVQLLNKKKELFQSKIPSKDKITQVMGFVVLQTKELYVKISQSNLAMIFYQKHKQQKKNQRHQTS